MSADRCLLIATVLSAGIVGPAMAKPVTEPGRYTCTSDEGWKYYYAIHALDGTEMYYSRGHKDVVSGWETSCYGKSFPIFEYCRDMDRVDDDAASEPHARLYANCLPDFGRYTCALEGRTDVHFTIDRIEGNDMVGKMIVQDANATSYNCDKSGALHELADCPNLTHLDPDAVSVPHLKLEKMCANEEKNQ